MPASGPVTRPAHFALLLEKKITHAFGIAAAEPGGPGGVAQSVRQAGRFMAQADQTLFQFVHIGGGEKVAMNAGRDNDALTHIQTQVHASPRETFLPAEGKGRGH